LKGAGWKLLVVSGAVSEDSPEGDFDEDLRPVSESQIDMAEVMRR
jgi:hypothetical protein